MDQATREDGRDESPERYSLHLRVEPALADALARFAHATHRSKNGAASYLLWRALADEQPRRGGAFQPEPTETR